MVKQVKKATSDTVVFSKRLAGVVVALSLFSFGLYGIYLGHEKTSLAVCSAALMFSGALNVVVSTVVLYRVLMNKEG